MGLGFSISNVIVERQRYRRRKDFVITMCVCMLSHVLPGSSVLRILQPRILEWVAISSCKESSWPRDWTHVSCVSCIGRQILYHCATWETLSIIKPSLFTPSFLKSPTCSQLTSIKGINLSSYFWVHLTTLPEAENFLDEYPEKLVGFFP